MKVGVVSTLEVDALDREGAFLREGGGRVVLCTSERTGRVAIEQLREAGAEVVVAGAARVDLTASLAALAAMGVARLMVEGGSTLVAALLTAGLVDELQLAMAPLLFGGDTAPTPVGGPGWSREAAIGLHLLETSTSPDGDVIVRYGLDEAAP